MKGKNKNSMISLNKGTWARDKNVQKEGAIKLVRNKKG